MNEDSEKISPQDPLGLLKDGDDQSSIVPVVIGAWSGPLPPPIILEQYGHIIDDAPNRIFKLMERQANHRMCCESAELEITKSRIKISGWGLAVGSAITLMLAGGGLWLIYKGFTWPGVSVIGMDLAGIAGVFVYGTRVQMNGQ